MTDEPDAGRRALIAGGALSLGALGAPSAEAQGRPRTQSPGRFSGRVIVVTGATSGMLTAPVPPPAASRS